MALFDDLPPPRKLTHEIGQDLATLSIGELDERVDWLMTEIERIKAVRATKLAGKAAAESVFKL
jgi:uncharacterized small protein (DUF1192 family)